MDFGDYTYDGRQRNGELLDGLGQLTDGIVGSHDFNDNNGKLSGLATFARCICSAHTVRYG